MTAISGLNSQAILILQQATLPGAAEQRASGSDTMVAVANGMSDKVSVGRQPGQAESRIAESMFSVNHVSANELKLDLIERAGKALGVDQADYESKDQFVAAMVSALGKIEMQDDGREAIAAIEQDLGLDKLGVSLADVIDSVNDDGGDDALTKALEKQTSASSDDPTAFQPLAFRPDDLGLYGAPNRLGGS